MEEKLYINPSAGTGHFGSDYPASMTKEDLIKLCAEEAVGSSKGIRGEIDSYLDYLESTTKQKIDFRFDDLTTEELGIVDSIVFECADCGWNCSTDEEHYDCGDLLCDDCNNTRKEDSDDNDNDDYDDDEDVFDFDSEDFN